MSQRLERLCAQTKLALFALAFSLACAPASADTAAPNPPPPSPLLPPGTTACSGFGAFANDRDPNGLNVRAEPDAHAKILGRLPPPLVYAADDIWYATASVIGFKKGWFLIEGGEADDQEDTKTGKTAAKFAPYSGRGWVSANLVTAQLGTPVVEAPDGTSSMVVVLDSYQNTKARRILSCSGPWLHVEVVLPAGVKPEFKTDAPPGTVRGWVDGTCETQKTPCDFGAKIWAPPAAVPLPAE
jgi:hypothetical protein